MNVVLRLTEAAVEFLWWWGGWGLQSHFHVQPNHYCVEVVLRCVVVGVVTILISRHLGAVERRISKEKDVIRLSGC